MRATNHAKKELTLGLKVKLRKRHKRNRIIKKLNSSKMSCSFISTYLSYLMILKSEEVKMFNELSEKKSNLLND